VERRRQHGGKCRIEEALDVLEGDSTASLSWK
jgi:hypothetical protein